MGLFETQERLPVWFMRQAGRYHSHYQNIKKDSDFMTMCKSPELATEITLGPIQDFNFDAAILFSDLLFPLEHLGLGLHYNDGPPRLTKHLKSTEDIDLIRPLAPAEEFYQFQGQAVKRLKEKLPKDRDLLGFVGAPFTLFTYAVEGSHGGNLVEAKKGLYDGRFEAFYDVLFKELVTEMAVQAKAGADAICLFDTAAGELCFKDYKQFIVPATQKIFKEFKRQFPKTKIIYYSKFTHLHYIEEVACDEIDVLGVDWRHDLNKVFDMFSKDFYIQGNMDPAWLHLPTQTLMSNMSELIESVDKKYFKKWIFGLGHGVLINTPEENVRQAVKLVQGQLRH